MKRYSLSLALSMLAAATIFNSQLVLSTEVHHRLMMQSLQADADAAGKHNHQSPPPQLIGLQAHFTQAYPTVAANADGSDVWPCLGRGNNTDCAMIGNPPVPLPRGGIVMGRPAFTWALLNNNIIGFGLGNGTRCDALTNGTV